MKRLSSGFSPLLHTSGTRCVDCGAHDLLVRTGLSWVLLSEHADKWSEIRLPAIAEEGDALGRIPGQALCSERYNEDSLNQIKHAVGARVWNALYQQRPSSQEGNILKREWFQLFDDTPTHFDEMIQSWDLSFTGKDTSDFVVGQVWIRKGSQKFLVDRVRERLYVYGNC